MTFAYSLPTSGPERLELLGALGRRVALLVDETLAVGPHEARFRASGPGQEFYLVRLTTAQGSFSQKLARHR